MEVSIDKVKQLREKTGAGIMDCKKALAETGGDIDAAVEFLRKKGMAKAAKLVSRKATEGLVHAYIHPGGRIGALVEVNCETDFVARTDEFKTLVNDIAMQVAATAPQALTPDDLDDDIIEKEKEIYRSQAVAEGKPEKIVEKIGKFIIFHSPPVEGALKDIDKFGSAFADEITVGVARNLHRIRNTAFAAGAAAMMAYSAGFGSSEIAPPPGMGPMGTLAYDIARTTIATSPQPLVVAKPPLDIATVPLPPDYWYVPLPSKIKTDTGITNGSIGSLEAGGAASGLGGIGGGITSYFTQHFERGSIILNAQHLDFESFADMVAKAVERKIKGD